MNHYFLNYCLILLNNVNAFYLSDVPSKFLYLSQFKYGFIIFYSRTVVGINASTNCLFLANSFIFSSITEFCITALANSRSYYDTVDEGKIYASFGKNLIFYKELK
jgi:hypothetical protein